MTAKSGEVDRALLDMEKLRLTEQLCFSIYSAHHVFNRLYKPLLEPLSLTYPQYLVMMALWESDVLSVKDLGRRLGLDSGTLTPLLKRLEKGGYIERKRDVADERRVLISLTAEGKALKTRARAIPDAVMEACGGNLTQISQLKTRLEALCASIETRETGR